MCPRRIFTERLPGIATPWARRTLRSGPTAAEGAAVLPDAGVAVVNFHGSLRCETCLRIGALSRATVERGFAAELADGRVSWTEVDFDQPGQAHFRDAYDIFASTVVVVARRDGTVDCEGSRQGPSA